MPTSIAKVFMSGRSQAVRLPKEFRLPGSEVRIRRVGDAIVLEPIQDLRSVFDQLDEFNDRYGPFELDREQPPMPADRKAFD